MWGSRPRLPRAGRVGRPTHDPRLPARSDVTLGPSRSDRWGIAGVLASPARRADRCPTGRAGLGSGDPGGSDGRLPKRSASAPTGPGRGAGQAPVIIDRSEEEPPRPGRVGSTSPRGLQSPCKEDCHECGDLIVEGAVKPDGTLELPQKLDLPAGRVQVTVRSMTEPTRPDRFWEMMESLWADLRTAAEPRASGRRSMRRSTPCETRRKRRCRLSSASRRSVAGPGSKPRGAEERPR